MRGGWGREESIAAAPCLVGSKELFCKLQNLVKEGWMEGWGEKAET